MSTTTLNATETYYHLTPTGNTEAATSWQSGGPRKGTENGQMACGIVLFKRSQIRSAISGKDLTSATLVLHRDSAYGSQDVDISIAYLLDEDVSGNFTYEECRQKGANKSHKLVTVKGTTCNIKLPGFWLYRASAIYGFLIYQETGEGTTTPTCFTGTAELKLNVYDQGTHFDAPVWMRQISREVYISSPVSSHRRDLSEIEYYINLRLAYNSLSTISVALSYLVDDDYILYKDWPTIIKAYQQAISDGTNASIYGKESKTAIVWEVPDDDDLPTADVINQIRNALEAPVSGQKESLGVTQYARTQFDHMGSDFTVNLNEDTTWSKRGPWSGMNWEYVKVNNKKEKRYNRRFGIWMLNNITAGKTVTNAKLRLTRVEGAGGKQEIKLYPVTRSSLPNTRMSVNDVMDTSTVVGTAKAVVGETVEIELSDAFISGLGSTYYGVGVNDKQYWTNFGGEATLIINDS